jgi:hypothetical protein
MDETWMIFLLPETGLQVRELTGLAAEARLRTKETCFGALVEGDAGLVKNFLDGLRLRYSHRIYIKKRGFSIDDTGICASTFGHVPGEGLPPWLTRYASQVKRYTS